MDTGFISTTVSGSILQGSLKGQSEGTVLHVRLSEKSCRQGCWVIKVRCSDGAFISTTVGRAALQGRVAESW